MRTYVQEGEEINVIKVYVCFYVRTYTTILYELVINLNDCVLYRLYVHDMACMYSNRVNASVNSSVKNIYLQNTHKNET